ncbi:hypothetical protein [Methanothermococcus okinawensis]|uniref:Flagellin N-methylase n=1 Tax=Methanothermococcus okinawensis (strain DSM 14208 / JCM 11175 / IH1) TaxID=647113 RepID=F8AJL7_METOI|nr:hypothetical protein [Methanothermococcus okinawensis]AEH07203.1 protein of unknown function UPF0153 [Methanothermococcus okinawensis IH1]
MDIFHSKYKTLKYDRNMVIKISGELFQDELCKRCGRCCIVNVYIDPENKSPVITYCKHFDKETKLCKIYKDRFKKEKTCLSMMEAIMAQALPKDCPYVKNIKNYKEPKCYEILRNYEKNNNKNNKL